MASEPTLPLEVADLTAEWLEAALSLRHPGARVRELSVDDVIWGTATKVHVRDRARRDAARLGAHPPRGALRRRR